MMNMFQRVKRYAARKIQEPVGPQPSRLGYSAYGEDILAISWFQHFTLDLTAVRYLDIGAAHPWEINNTFAFYLLGAKGVLWNPIPTKLSAL